MYAYVTYIVLMIVYSANNLPYSALSGVMTGDVAERTSLSSYRFVFAMLSQLIIQGARAADGARTSATATTRTGYQVTMGIFSVLAVVFFIITFATTKERMQPDPTQQSSIKQDFGDLLRNGPWMAMFVLTIVLFITLSLRGGVMLYYFKYYVQPTRTCSAWFNRGAAPAVTIVGVVALQAARACAIGQAQRCSSSGLSLTVLFTALFVFLPPTAVPAIIVDGRASAVRVRLHHPAAVGDDGRRRRLLRVEDRPPRDGDRLLGHRLRPEGGARLRRRDRRLAAVALRLRAERGADRARARRHPLHGEHLPGRSFLLCVICLFFYKIGKTEEMQIDTDLTERRRRLLTAPVSGSPVVAP